MRAKLISRVAVTALAGAIAGLSLPASAEMMTAQEIISELTASPDRGIELGVSGSQAPDADGDGAAAPDDGAAASSGGTVTPPPPSIDLEVNFAFGSARLTDQARQQLNELGTAMLSAELSAFTFRIAGHTDAVGSEAYNLALSQRRSQAVVSYLTETFGIAPARLLSVGLGETELLDPADPNSGVNRRVEITNLGAAG